MNIDANVMADFTERSIKVYSAEQSAWSDYSPSNQTNGIGLFIFSIKTTPTLTV